MNRSDCVTVGSVIEGLFSRGELPTRIVALRDAWPIVRAGDQFVWCDERSGFVCARGRDLICRAGVIRDGWNFLYGEAPQAQAQSSAA